jgi:hypothetical protein
MIRRWLVALSGMAAGLLLCWALIARLGLRAEDWMRPYHALSWTWTGIIALVTAFLWWSGARKWAIWSRAMHGAAGAEPLPRFFMRHYAWQNWIGLFVPPQLAIILGRSWAVRHMPGVGWRAGVGNAFYDQLMEFVFLAGLLPAAGLVLLYHVDGTVWLPVAAGGMLAAGGAMWLLRSRIPAGASPFLFSLLAWSAARVILTVISYVLGAWALRLAIDPSHIVAAAPLVAGLVLIPLTPGNLGLAEWGWTGVLALAGTNAAAAGLFALGFRVLMLVVQSALLIVHEGLFFIFQQRES